MRIALLCNDTRGGVQPYVALALGLSRAGHEVRAVAPQNLTSLFTDAGLPCAALEGDLEAVLKGSGGVTEKGAVAATMFAARELPKRLEGWTRTTLEACEGAELLVGGIGGMVLGLGVAEKLRVPFVEAHLQPVGAPTDRYPGVLWPTVPRWLGGGGRRLSHHLTELALWGPFRPLMAKVRRSVLQLRGAAPTRAHLPVVYGFSRHVVPLDEQSGPPPRHATGYWTLEAKAFTPPPALAAFLDAPGPVVSVGFGSMASADAAALTRLVVDAARSSQFRTLLLTGWGGLAAGVEGAADVLAVDAVPHDWLFSRVHTIVHHGGAGTTGAALRGGVPSVVVPFSMDQPFWGSRVAALGVGPAPVPRRALTVERLAAALEATRDEGMRTKARGLGELLRAEDGVGAAVKVIGGVVR